MLNEIEFFSTKQEDAFNSMANKIITNYNQLGGCLTQYKDFNDASGIHHLLRKVYTIIFDRGDPLSVPVFLKRVATGKIKGLGKPDGDANARLEDTFLGFGHFRSDGRVYVLNENELKALNIYLRKSKIDIATTSFKYKGLTIESVLFKSGVLFPNSKDDKMLHNQFKVSVTSEKGIKTKFDFFGSYNDYKEGVKELKDADLLNAFDCFINDAISAEEDFENWCHNFGYDTDSRTAHKIYKECLKSLDKAKNIITGDLYEFYNELQEAVNA